MLVSAALLTGLTYFCLWPALAFMLPRQPWKSWNYWLITLGIGGLIIGFEVFVHLMQFDKQQAFFTWHWSMTLALGLISAILIFISSKNDPTRQVRRGTSNK
jgi:hypothetical protein